MKNILHFAIVVLLLLNVNITVVAQESQKEAPKLQHWMTADELTRKHLIGKDFTPTDPPPGDVTNISEFMPMQGVVVRYPFGIPINLIAEMSEIATVTTIVASSSQQTSVTATYQSSGVNMANINFLIAPTDSYWTRDYGPWFVLDGNDEFGITDFPYNRPRPDDNNVPSAVAGQLGINLWGMNLIETGGNYMSDGYGKAFSTDLVVEENPTLNDDEIAAFANDYLGVNPYYIVNDPLGDYIKHVDCWGKLLDVDKVIIGQVPTSDSRYQDFEDAANFFATTASSWGNNYEVYRVYTPGGSPATPYSNSLILNDHVYVPQTGSQWDDEAIAAYEEAMPGYEIVGIMQASSTPWENTDALHCRTKGIADLGMLYIKHFPLLGNQELLPNYNIEAEIKALSSESFVTDSLLVYYRANGSAWETTSLTNSSGDTFEATIPGAAAGSQIDYFIFAKDESGRRENCPYIGAPDPFTFFVGEQALPEIYVSETALATSAPVASFDETPFIIKNEGEIDLNYTLSTDTKMFTTVNMGTVENSPAASSYNSNTYTELGWTDLSVSGSGNISTIEINFNWITDTYPEEGSLWLESPTGTQVTISAPASGAHTVTFDNFEGEELNGSWKLWIEDTYGDGGHQATDISLTADVLESEIEWLTVSPENGTLLAGEEENITAHCSAADLTAGVYLGTILIESNDPTYPEIELPVTFTVTSSGIVVLPDTAWILSSDNPVANFTIKNSADEAITVTEISEINALPDLSMDLEHTLPYSLAPNEEMWMTFTQPISKVDLHFGEYQVSTALGNIPFWVAVDMDEFPIYVANEAWVSTQIFPNPASNHLEITLSVNQQENLLIQIMDAKGQTVATLINSTVVGEQNIRWDIPANIATGLYFCRITNGTETIIEKVIIH